MVVQLKNISVRKEGKALLKDINWKINKGEHWSVLGLNGSGKTMLLKIISGYLWPTSGEVEVLGETFGKYPIGELRKSIGWVSSSFQEMLHEYEYAENIVLSGKFASIGIWQEPTQEDIDEALSLMEQLGCTYLINRPFELLSQGERQRILIARALMAKPKLLILDEPCTGLDLFAREDLLERIDYLSKNENAPTLIYVTHHIDEILPAFTHALLLKNGEVFDAGDKETMLSSDKLSSFFDRKVECTWSDGKANLSVL